jgi:hypothetical protein
MVRGGVETTRVKDWVAVSGGRLAAALVKVLVTCITKVKVPAAVGVPDRVPLVDSVIPGGRVPDARAKP